MTWRVHPVTERVHDADDTGLALCGAILPAESPPADLTQHGQPFGRACDICSGRKARGLGPVNGRRPLHPLRAAVRR